MSNKFNIRLYKKIILSNTNYKDIGILYLVFSFIAGLIGSLFSIIIRIELAYLGVQILDGNYFVTLLIVASDVAFPRLYILINNIINIKIVNAS